MDSPMMLTCAYVTRTHTRALYVRLRPYMDAHNSQLARSLPRLIANADDALRNESLAVRIYVYICIQATLGLLCGYLYCKRLIVRCRATRPWDIFGNKYLYSAAANAFINYLSVYTFDGRTYICIYMRSAQCTCDFFLWGWLESEESRWEKDGIYAYNAYIESKMRRCSERIIELLISMGTWELS